VGLMASVMVLSMMANKLMVRNPIDSVEFYCVKEYLI
jgi:hypothetical protein